MTRNDLYEGLVAGSVASLVSTAALLAAGRRETGSAFTPLNAISHWRWGEEAIGRQRPDLRHTAVGLATHQLSSVFWAALHSAAARRFGLRRAGLPLMASSMAMSGLACLADYRFTPPRLRPGFEQRLSRRAIAGVYGAFALGLAMGVVVARPGRLAGAEAPVGRRQKLLKNLPAP